jgi:hypothetical protein
LYLSKAIIFIKAIFSLVMQVEESLSHSSKKKKKNLSHSFEETNVDQTGLDESDNNLSSLV